jgi:2-(1,2-epoxy-1,2-dihydrophenyl)acetyl-CoA isomerase
MAHDTVSLTRADGVATLTLNRPALDMTLGRDLLAAVIEADEDREARAILVTGAGKAFCGGGDVKSFVDNLGRIGAHIKELTTYFHGAISRLCRSEKPVLMAVNGVAAGGGMSFALAGDLVFAAESARFTMAYSKIGATPDGSSTYMLPRLVGLRRAMELYFTNRVLTAREAEAWGLITRAVPDNELVSTFGGAKRLFHQATWESLETQMELEAQAIAASGHTEDFRAGVTAFANKRPAPTFTGR